jgi:phosphomannomutase/phosphoglucomutase
MKKINEKIFREYDLRGVVEKEINKDIAILIGKAFGSLLKIANPQARYVSVGRDVRLSSEELSSGIIKGIISTGLDVYDIGICPTPLQYFSLFHLNLDGGIMVTGSHNPPEYNGFKISIGKETIHGKSIQKLKEIILREQWISDEREGKVTGYDIISAYKDYMLKEFSYLGDPKFDRIKVVIDAGNATAGLVAPEILGSMGCDVVPLYCEPDGRFPNHHPDPTIIEYIQDLISLTKETGAEIGVGYDGDADRIGVVDRDGEIVWGDHLMVILSRELLKLKPGAKIIGDVKCSQIMFDDIKANGGIPIMWKTGHSLVKQKMREEGALIAGEFSGHIFIADRYFGYDDAIYTTLRLVEIIKTTGKDVKELLSDIPKLYYTPEIRLECPEDRKRDIVEKIVLKFSEYGKEGGCPHRIEDINTTDGVRVAFERGWGLIRSSNTQPVVVLRVEAEDEESLKNYRTFLEKEFKDVMEVK